MSVYVGKSDGGWYTASVGNDFSQGRRGMARSVRGAKKFVRSRVRAANKRELLKEIENV